MSERMITGRIIKVSRSGWGFIISKEIEFTRIFFHWTALRNDTLRFPELKRGMYVDFVPIEVPEKGYRAIKIRVLTKREQEHQEEIELTEVEEPDEDDIKAVMPPLSE